MDKFQSHFSGCSEFVNFIFDMVVTNSAHSSFTTNTLFFMQSSLSHTLYFSHIVSVIFIFGESGTRICLAFNTIMK